MRVLMVGLGGAGCRILDLMHSFERRAPVRCVAGVVVDSDAGALNILTNIPPEHRLFFQTLDPSHPDDLLAQIPHEEIVARMHALNDGDIDAVFVCCGLGGTMAETAPEIISRLKTTMVEPVFGLCILPCRNEGEERSARAADQIERIAPLLDGIIVFDNETLKEKIPPPADEDLHPQKLDLGRMLSRKQPPPVDRKTALLNSINEVITRRLIILFRAGEHMDKGPEDLPEVVLDAGEVLNTIKGMGFITIGYARREVTTEGGSMNPIDIISRFRGGKAVDVAHIKASRVVEVAKSAINEEISTPTELDKAKKALILIAGPSDEMSMRGFMTVKKWIDRSIDGLEVRSGDYPLHDTRFLALVIVLAGMETLPRLEELKRIREQWRLEHGTPEVLRNRLDVSSGSEDTRIF